MLFEIIWKSLPCYKRDPLLYLVLMKEKRTLRGPVHGNAPQSLRLAHFGLGGIKYAIASGDTLLNFVFLNMWG